MKKKEKYIKKRLKKGKYFIDLIGQKKLILVKIDLLGQNKTKKV